MNIEYIKSLHNNEQANFDELTGSISNDQVDHFLKCILDIGNYGRILNENERNMKMKKIKKA